MKQPLISVIIPTFNREKLIAQSLESVINQSYDNWECIVVDDGSSDNTVKIIKEYLKKETRLRFFKRDRRPKGAPTCRNIGLDNANGKYIIFVDSDDILLKGCLQNRVFSSKKLPNLDFYVFPVSIEQDLKQPTFQNIWLERGKIFDNDLSAFLLWSQWQTMSVLWKREAVLKVGGFNEELTSSQDGYLHREALIEGLKYHIFKDNAIDALYRINSTSLTNQMTDDKWYSRFLSFKWNYLKMRDKNLVTKLNKDLILGQFLFCIKHLMKFKNSRYRTEIEEFIIKNEFMTKDVYRLILFFVLRNNIFLLRKVAKKISSFWFSKYILWKV